MKTKTVHKIIKKKMESFIATLPSELREGARDNIVVTGGCIASLLLQEEVNDFDLYIIDRDYLKKLCEHFLKIARSDDPRFDDMVLLDYETDYLDKLPSIPEGEDYPHNTIARRNLEPGQLKFNIEALYGNRAGLNNASDNEYPFKVLYISPNAISLSDDVQIVNRFWGKPEELHKNYDFVHATNYWTYETGLVTNTDALEALLARELRYIGSRYPITSVIRMRKFIKRKFNISAGDILKMCYQISELDLNDQFILEEQLIGVDVGYFSALLAIIKKHDGKIDYTFMSDIIDRVFHDSEEDN